LKRLLNNFRWGVLPVPGRVIAVVFFVFVFVFPLISDDRYILLVLIFTNIFVIFAVSWDVLSGYTGLVNFGHALFFGVGAYGSALLFKYLGWQPWLTIPLGAVAATLIGVITCWPALKLRGPYLSLLTLSFPLMLYGIVYALPSITGGPYGIWGIPLISQSRVVEYYVVLIREPIYQDRSYFPCHPGRRDCCPCHGNKYYKLQAASLCHRRLFRRDCRWLICPCPDDCRP
jgi:branched-chain amino acid transport system permease protein